MYRGESSQTYHTQNSYSFEIGNNDHEESRPSLLENYISNLIAAGITNFIAGLLGFEDNVISNNMVVASTIYDTFLK